MDILKASKDKNLLAPFFKDPKTWRSWFTFWRALFGLKMGKKDLKLYQDCTGRDRPPEEAFKEAYVIVGRRGGKTDIISKTAVYQALFVDYSPFLAPGELATILIIAVDKMQAGIILRYIKTILGSVPMFADKIVRERTADIELSNRVQILVRTANLATVRGYTLAACILEEVSFWKVEGQNPDREILSALRPALSTIPTSMLLAISSPYSRSGIMYESFRDNYGRDDSEALIWQAPTVVMNPTISQEYVDKELEKDPEAGRAEWLAEFRKDISNFLPLEWIQSAVIDGRYELGSAGFHYLAFTDPSGGAGDAFTLSIGHNEGNKLIQDVLKSVNSPFNPHKVVKDYADVLKQYGLTKVKGDRYSAQWVVSAFQGHGIRYVHSDLNKSQIYLEFEPLLAQGRVELLDNRTLFNELRGLERRTGRTGKDSVDHGPRGKDDSANATAGVLVELAAGSGRVFPRLKAGSLEYVRLSRVEEVKESSRPHN